METISQKIFCAFCKLQRRIVTKKNCSWTNVLLSFVASSLVMFAVWGEINPKMLMFFVLFLAICETFIHIRWRMGLPCPHCGFDPLTYKTDREEAARRVQRRLEQVKQSGMYMLKQNNPFTNLAPRPVAPGEAQKERVGKHLSREI